MDSSFSAAASKVMSAAAAFFAFAGIGAAYGSVPRRVQRIGLSSRTLHFAVSQAGAQFLAGFYGISHT